MTQTEEDEIINLTRNAGIKHLIKNQNSVHVLIQIVEKIHASNTIFIQEYVETHLIDLCKDKYAICFIKAVLKKQEWISRLENLIINDAE